MSKRSSRGQVIAFNLVPVVEHVLPDRPKTEVECITTADQSLYVGTADGLIVYYQLEENISPLGKIIYQSKVKGRIQLGGDKRKPIQQLTVVLSQKRLIALVDGTMYLMNMATLELYDTGQRIAKVIVAPQRRKQIQQYVLSGERLVHIKDYSIPEPALTMARDGNFVCVALSGQDGKYVVINIQEGNMFDLLNYDAGCTPIVRRMGKGEFLVNAGTFGITTTTSGMSNRPPVEWGGDFRPKSTTYIFPYIVAWSQEAEVIKVFNLVHQRCVQEIPFSTSTILQNGRYMTELCGRLYAARDKSVYLLSSVPLKDQVNDLLERRLVQEAVLLAETVAAVEASKSISAAEEYMNEVKLKAAFIYLATGSFSQSESLLHESGCDPREVIVLFEGLLPRGSSFQPVAGHLHSLPSIQAIAVASDEVSLREAKKFLIRYLKDVRTKPLALGRREDIDTSLVKLLAEDHSPSLVEYISNHDLHLSFEETKAALEEYHCYHPLALLYYFSNQTSEALKIWTQIYDKELTDPQFPGFNYIIEFLSTCGNIEVVLQYAKWALDRNQEMAARIFTERVEGEKSEQLEPHFLLDFLKPYPDATLMYLEYLVNDGKSKEESFHTQLASSYLNQLLRLREDTAPERELKMARVKLQTFLESSTHYDPACLLTQVEETEMYRECAVLYGRMEEHEKALTLLAHKLRDHPKAQDYCETYSEGKGRVYRQNLYQTLLRVYLQPQDSSSGKPDVLITPALSLLNSHGAQFDAAQVLLMLPPDWPIVTVKSFLLHSVRGTMDAHRTAKIEYNLARGENLQVRGRYISLQGDPIVITENTRCPVCNLSFSDAAFVRYPNGIITHLKCGRNKTICPVTGTWFGKV